MDSGREFGGDHEEVCVKNLKQAVDIMVKSRKNKKFDGHIC